MENFIASQSQQNKEFLNQHTHTNELMRQLKAKVDTMATHHKMLETQVSQVAQQQSTSAAPTGSFSGQPQPNPKEHVNAITTRNMHKLQGPVDPEPRDQTQSRNVEEEKDKSDASNEPIGTKENSKPEDKEDNERARSLPTPPPYQPPIPFPQRLAKYKRNGQFKKFVEVLK